MLQYRSVVGDGECGVLLPSLTPCFSQIPAVDWTPPEEVLCMGAAEDVSSVRWSLRGKLQQQVLAILNIETQTSWGPKDRGALAARGNG